MIPDHTTPFGSICADRPTVRPSDDDNDDNDGNDSNDSNDDTTL